MDAAIKPDGQLYYCPSCAAIEGLLTYYPHLRQKLEVVYVDFPKPRIAIVDLIGEVNQGCPVLVIDTERLEEITYKEVKEANGNYFIASTQLIMDYLAHKY